jgi:hypothetical protein
VHESDRRPAGFPRPDGDRGDHPGIEASAMTLASAWRLAGFVFAVFALVLAILVFRAHWARPGDFDVIGFLWLTENAGPISLAIMCLFSAGTSLYCLVRAAR